MAGKPWTRERRMEQAAKRAEKAALDTASPVESPEPETEKAPSFERPPASNPRDDALEQIAAHRLREAGIEEPKPEEEAKKEEPKPEEVKAEPEAKPEPVAEAAPEVKTVKVKVDGEEFEVSQDEIDEAGGVRAYQQIRASENRLKKTNEALAEARRLQAFLIEQATKGAPKPKEPSDDEFIQSKMETIRFGTPEEGAAALREILGRSRVDPNQITNNATQAAVVHMARTQATQKFKEEFSDVATNPLLMKLAFSLENERLAQLGKGGANPVSVDWHDFYRRIGNEIRTVVRPSQPTVVQATNGNPSPASEKEARKASIVNLPTAGARAELPKEEKPETREDILADMRKGRPL